MKTNLLSLEFASNMFGKLKPEIKARLQAVIDNPCQETWDNSYSLILSGLTYTTLWQAVSKIDSNFQSVRGYGKKWTQIPSRETIIEAIKLAVYEGGVREKTVSKETYNSFYKNQ